MNGAFFALFWFRVRFDRRKITRRSLITGGLGAAVAAGGWLEHDSIRVERVRARPTNYAGPELRVGFLSDLHIACEHDFQRAMRAVEMMAALKPDVLLLGGDYVSRGGGSQNTTSMTSSPSARKSPRRREC